MEQMLATSRRSCSAGGGLRTASSSRTRRIRSDLALLEEHVAPAAAAAAGVGVSRDSGSFLRDDYGRVLAGISGIVWGGYCEVQAMRVDESLRGRGLARALVAGAEHEARRRGCALVVFHAYDLLALDSTSGSATRPSASSRLI
jgi:GNAT superfamily N-acetyltransferase